MTKSELSLLQISPAACTAQSAQEKKQKEQGRNQRAWGTAIIILYSSSISRFFQGGGFPFYAQAEQIDARRGFRWEEETMETDDASSAG
jgi:hypothetical protein